MILVGIFVGRLFVILVIMGNIDILFKVIFCVLLVCSVFISKCFWILISMIY